MPHIVSEGDRIRPYLEEQNISFSAADKTAAKHIKALLVVSI